MSAHLKDSNLQILAVSSGMFAHSQHESAVCGLPLRRPYAAAIRRTRTLRSAKCINTSVSISQWLFSCFYFILIYFAKREPVCLFLALKISAFEPQP